MIEPVPRTVKWYAALLLIGAMTLLTSTIRAYASSVALSAREVIACLLFVLLIPCAARFPLHVSSKTKVVVDTSLIFAALLLFPRPWGPLVAALGVLIGHLLFWRDLLDIIVNTSIVIIEGLCVQWVFLHLGGAIPPRFEETAAIVPLIGAGLAALTLERLSVAGAVALYQGVGFGQVFVGSWTNKGLREDIALVSLGVLTAMAVRVQLWALLLTSVPVVLVYLSLRNSLRLTVLTRDAVESMADVIDARDPYTAGHSARVAQLAQRIAVKQGLSWEEAESIRAAARVHDLGKITVDASVLNKPGLLSDDDWEAMRRHPIAGAEIVSRFPEFARGSEYVRHHHERWDGRGYPEGLRGEEIPLGGCIIAVADAYDAMTSDRPYRRALTPDMVLGEFRHGAGIQWNGQTVAALFRVLEEDGIEVGARAVPAPVHA